MRWTTSAGGFDSSKVPRGSPSSWCSGSSQAATRGEELPFLRWRNVGEPPVEPGRAEARVGAGNKRLLVYFDAEIARLRVGHHLARVVVIFEDLADWFVQCEWVGPGDLDHAVHRLGQRRLGDRACHVVGRHRLEQHRRQAHRVALGRELGNRANELEELGGVDKRVWNWRALDELL